MKFKKMVAVLLAAAVSASVLSGCGIDKSKTVATLKDEEVTLGVFNFLCRWQQAEAEQYNKQMYDLYAQMGYAYGSAETDWTEVVENEQGEADEDGKTKEQDLKEQLMDTLHKMLTLKAHMSDYDVTISPEESEKITEAANAFIRANEEETLEEMGATQEIVEEVLNLYTIQSKMEAAIKDAAEIEVTEEEANMAAYSLLDVEYTSTTDESGETVDYTQEEQQQIEANVKKVINYVKKGKSLKSAAKKLGYEELVTEGAYATDEKTYAASESDLNENVKNALDGLKQGEVSELIKTEDCYMVVTLDKKTDKEATQEKKESLMDEKKEEAYNNLLEEWQKEDGWEVKEKLFDDISFKNTFTITTEETEDSETGNEESTTEK